MAITMYDLCGAEAERRFSPFCWRARMALAHKGLEVETIPWRFTEKEKLPTPNAGRVPVIVDDGRVVHDSPRSPSISMSATPTVPSLFGGEIGRGADALRAELDRHRSAERPDPARAARHPRPSRPRGSGIFPPGPREALWRDAGGGRPRPRDAAAGIPRQPRPAAPHRRAPGFRLRQGAGLCRLHRLWRVPMGARDQPLRAAGRR